MNRAGFAEQTESENERVSEPMVAEGEGIRARPEVDYREKKKSSVCDARASYKDRYMRGATENTTRHRQSDGKGRERVQD